MDPDSSKRELYELLESGGEVKWTMMLQVSGASATSVKVVVTTRGSPRLLQVMSPEDVQKVKFDPFDVTKVR